MRWLILIVAICALPLVTGYVIKNEKYAMTVGIVSGSNLSNTNYTANINLYTLEKNLSNLNYTLNIGYLFIGLPQEILSTYHAPGVEISSGGGSYNEQHASTTYYDVRITGIKPFYFPFEIINFKIILINKGDLPDRDAVLSYYLVGPNGAKHLESREVFEEIPASCPYMKYNEVTDMCITANNTKVTPKYTILERNWLVPLDAIYGNWKAYAEYETEVQPLIVVYNSFQIAPLYMLILVLITIFIYIFSVKKKGGIQND